MKKKELREQLIIANDVVLKLHDELTMVKLENQMLRKTLYSQEEEIRVLTTLLANMKDKVSQLNNSLHFREVYEPKENK